MTVSTIIGTIVLLAFVAMLIIAPNKTVTFIFGLLMLCVSVILLPFALIFADALESQSKRRDGNGNLKRNGG